MSRKAELSWQLHLAVLPYLAIDWLSNERIICSNFALLKRRPRAKLGEGWVRQWAEAASRGPEAVAAGAMTGGGWGT